MTHKTVGLLEWVILPFFLLCILLIFSVVWLLHTAGLIDMGKEEDFRHPLQNP